ncbi:Large ribosomal subunit protein bL17c [Cardamine amara subsp. amara]|uniref:Large ribosomal subunit protein bL17c n=1 Tax=Cardamine amara subsp. amara TaxID=228776 RepID=A0ABD1B889_CARAN
MTIPMAMATAIDFVSRVWSMSSIKSALPSASSFRLPSSASSRHPVTSLNRTSRVFNSNADWQIFENGFKIVDGEGRIYAMRHGRRVLKLNRPPDQRKALLRGLTTQLLKWWLYENHQNSSKER